MRHANAGSRWEREGAGESGPRMGWTAKGRESRPSGRSGADLQLCRHVGTQLRSTHRIIRSFRFVSFVALWFALWVCLLCPFVCATVANGANGIVQRADVAFRVPHAACPFGDKQRVEVLVHQLHQQPHLLRTVEAAQPFHHMLRLPAVCCIVYACCTSSCVVLRTQPQWAMSPHAAHAVHGLHVCDAICVRACVRAPACACVRAHVLRRKAACCILRMLLISW